jgi:hypothetical protein
MIPGFGVALGREGAKGCAAGGTGFMPTADGFLNCQRTRTRMHVYAYSMTLRGSNQQLFLAVGIVVSQIETLARIAVQCELLRSELSWPRIAVAEVALMKVARIHLHKNRQG